MGIPPVSILIRMGVTQGDPLSVTLYAINLVPMAKETREADLGLLTLFYAYGVEFDGLSLRSTHLMKLLLERDPDRN